MSVIEIFNKGGVLIYPLLVLMVWGLVIIVMKWFALRRENIIKPGAVKEVERLLLAKKVPEATAFCKQNPAPMTRILGAAILNHDKDEGELKEVLEEAGRQEVPKIRSQLTTLGTIASVAPLLGLLGTVVGMISVFSELSRDANVNASALAGGISEALITTACGMAIAMPTLAFYNYFTTQVQNLIVEIEKVSLHMVAVLKRS